MSFIHYGAKKSIPVEYEYQTILPGLKEYLTLYDSLNKSSRYNFYVETYGKELAYKFSSTKKKVTRTLYSDKTQPSSYDKTKESITRPFTSIDLSTTFRKSTEESTTSRVVDSNNNKVDKTLFIRREYVDKDNTDVKIHLTLSWKIYNNTNDNNNIDAIDNIRSLIENRNHRPIISVSHRMFNQVIEAEFTEENAAKDYKNDYLNILIPIYDTLAGLNLTEKINMDFTIENPQYTIIWPPRRRNILDKAVNLSITDYIRKIVPNMSDFCVSPKADGIHTYILVPMDDNKPLILFSDMFASGFLRGEIYTDSMFDKLMNEHGLKDTQEYNLYEGEILEDERLLVYDYSEVGDSMETDVYMDKIRLHYSEAELKEKYHMINDAKEVIKLVAEKSYDYPIDGLIFNKCDSINKPFKWKEDHTVDFMAYVEEDSQEIILLTTIERARIKEFGLSRIFTYIYDKMDISHSMFNTYLIPFLIPVFKKDMPNTYKLSGKYDKNLHGKIIECSFDSVKGWKYIRTRGDKIIPNHYNVAMLSFLNQNTNLSLDMLLNPDKIDIFFTKERVPQFEEQRRYNSSVRAKIINKYIHPGNYVLDIGSGRGNTYFAMKKRQIEKVVMIDIDGAAISEFFQRIFESSSKDRTRVHVVQGSFISEDDVALVPRQPEYDVVFCSFAIHFAFASLYTLNVLVSLIKDVSKPGSKAIFLAIDGRVLSERLNGKREYRIPSEGQSKYKFLADDYIDSASGTGNKIRVQYPFSPDGKMGEEYMVDFDMLIRLLGEGGFKIITDKKFEEVFPDKFIDMTQIDKDFISLHRVIVLQRE